MPEPLFRRKKVQLSLLKGDGFSSQLLWTKNVMTPTFMFNFLPSNVTSLLTSFADMNPSCSFSTPSLPFVLTWFFILVWYLLSFGLPLKCTSSCPLTSHKHVFYYQLALPLNTAFHNSVNRAVPEKETEKAGKLEGASPSFAPRWNICLHLIMLRKVLWDHCLKELCKYRAQYS